MGYKNMYSFKFSCSRPKQHYHNSYIYHVSCHIIPGSLAPALPILNAYFLLFCQCICKASGEFPSLIPLHTLHESSQKDASYLLLQIPPHDIYILWCLQGAKRLITAGVSWESRDHRGITLKNAFLNNLIHIVDQYMCDYIAHAQIITSIYLLYPGLFWWRKTNSVLLTDKKGRKQRKHGRWALRWRIPDNFIDLEQIKHYDPGKSLFRSDREIAQDIFQQNI